MHEFAICEAVLAKVRELERPANSTVKRVKIRVGPLSGIEPELLARAYPFAAAGGIAEDSCIDIEPGQIRVRCTSCGAESQGVANRLVCPICGDWHTELLSGDELLLLAVEFEAPAEAFEAPAEASHV